MTGNLAEGRWIFDVGGDGGITADLECFQWYEKNVGVSINPPARLACPPFYDLASLDDRFVQESATETSERVCFVNVLPNGRPAIRCCYGKGLGASLITSPPLAGSTLTRNPLYFQTEDLYGYEKCCIQSNRCGAFFDLLPIKTSKNYKPPHWGR